MAFKLKIFSFFLLPLASSLAISPQATARQPAQENTGPGYRFQPPRPPPLDADSFEDDEDVFDMGEEGFQPPPPINPANNGNNSSPPSDLRPPPPPAYSQVTSTSAKKFRFQLVEGEYWEKGKKRSRGAQVRVNGSDN